MNLWIVQHYANTPAAVGSTRHFSLSKVLVDQGHRVTIIAANFHHFGQLPEQRANGMQVEEHSGVRYVLLPVSPYTGNGPGRIRNMLEFTPRALRVNESLAGGRPDVVVGSSPHPFAAWAGQRLARRYRVPFVFEVLDLWPQILIELGAFAQNHPMAVALRRLEGFLYQRASLTITVLPYAHEYIKRFGVPADRVFCLRMGVDLSDFPAREVRDNPDPFTLMYMGAHGVANGLNALLDVAAELERSPASRPVLWRLVGDGAEKPGLINRAARLGLRSVRFEGRVPKTHIPSLAAQADGFLFCLRDLDVYKYGVGHNKLFDYLAAQRPVIFGCAARNNPVAEAGAGLTVPPEDPAATAGAVRQLVSLSPDQREEMGRSGRRYVEAHHDYDRLGRSFEKVLASINHRQPATYSGLHCY